MLQQYLNNTRARGVKHATIVSDRWAPHKEEANNSYNTHHSQADMAPFAARNLCTYLILQAYHNYFLLFYFIVSIILPLSNCQTIHKGRPHQKSKPPTPRTKKPCSNNFLGCHVMSEGSRTNTINAQYAYTDQQKNDYAWITPSIGRHHSNLEFMSVFLKLRTTVRKTLKLWIP